MNEKYILNEKNEPILVEDIREWGQWFESANRSVAKTQVTPEIRVSTVFLGVDHNWDGGSPILWETMIFGGKNDGWMNRYTSHEDAVRGHEEAVILAKEGE